MVRFDPAVPEAGGAVEKTTLDGAAAATLKAFELTAVLTPLMPLGVAVKV